MACVTAEVKAVLGMGNSCTVGLLLFPKGKFMRLSKEEHLFTDTHGYCFSPAGNSRSSRILKLDSFISRPRGTRRLDAADSCNERKWSVGGNASLCLRYLL